MPVESIIWSIFFLPVAVFIVIALLVRPFFDRYSFIAGLLLIGALFLAFCISIWVLLELVNGKEFVFSLYSWLTIGSAAIEVGILLLASVPNRPILNKAAETVSMPSSDIGYAPSCRRANANPPIKVANSKRDTASKGRTNLPINKSANPSGALFASIRL